MGLFLKLNFRRGKLLLETFVGLDDLVHDPQHRGRIEIGHFRMAAQFRVDGLNARRMFPHVGGDAGRQFAQLQKRDVGVLEFIARFLRSAAALTSAQPPTDRPAGDQFHDGHHDRQQHERRGVFHGESRFCKTKPDLFLPARSKRTLRFVPSSACNPSRRLGAPRPHKGL